MRDRLTHRRDRVVGVVQRLGEQRDVDARVAQRAAFRGRPLPDDVRDLPARAASDRARFSTSGDRSTAMHASRPAAGFHRQVALAAAEIGDPSPAAAGARARAPTPPSSAPARAAARSCPDPHAPRSSLSGRAALPRAAHRRRAPSAVAPPASKCASSSGHSGPKPFCASRQRGGDAVVGEAGLALLAQSSPASFSRPRWRDTPDCARPRMPVSSVTFSRSARAAAAAGAAPRRRAAGTGRARHAYLLIYMH